VPLIDALSVARFATYVTWADGDQTLALRLYTYNSKLSGALHNPIHMLEVTLRNISDRQMAATFGAAWMKNAAVGLTPYQQACITSAEDMLRKQGKAIAHDPLVAELTFGFWTSLFGGKSHHLWRHLRPMFNAPGLQRRAVNQALTDMRTLRNRIAHHEPILLLPLAARYAAIRDMADWLEADAATWIQQHSTWGQVFLGAPTLLPDPVTGRPVVNPAVIGRLV
jgi:hypothetical protein